MRKLSTSRKLSYFIAKPILKILFKTLWLTCRVQPIIGQANMDQLLAANQTMIPCYWHQRHIFGTYYMMEMLKKGLKVGFLVSPSVDGEVPARLMKEWGAYVIRGSQNKTGAKAMKELFQLIKKEGVSPVNTPDGPTGPIHHFKIGTVMLAQLTQVPIVPISYGASSFWQLKTWDQFMIPKPFAKIKIAVGKPISVPKKISTEQLESLRADIEAIMLTVDEIVSNN